MAFHVGNAATKEKLKFRKLVWYYIREMRERDGDGGREGVSLFLFDLLCFANVNVCSMPMKPLEREIKREIKRERERYEAWETI